jgi:hypothetical protein
MKKVLTGVVCGMLFGVSAASAQTVGDCNSNGAGSDVVNGRTYEFLGGQVNGAGATLFVDFFTLPFLFNDAIDVDGDCIQGFNEPFIPQANLNGFPKWDPDTQSLISVDNLVDTFSGTPGEVNSGWWGFTYRSVGSVNGFSELISSELCGDLNTTPPSEEGIFNLFTYFDPDAPQGSQAFPGGINASGVPFEICEMTFAFLDVPGVWGAQALAAATPSPFNTPGAAGYGQNERVSAKGQSQKLASLLRDCDNNGSARVGPEHQHLEPGREHPVRRHRRVVAGRADHQPRYRSREHQVFRTPVRLPHRSPAQRSEYRGLAARCRFGYAECVPQLDRARCQLRRWRQCQRQDR